MDILDFESLDIRFSSDVVHATDKLIELRRDLHRHPELGNEETRTQRIVLEWLKKEGINARPLGGTGVVGLLEGKRPGKVLLLRADMDALPIAEENDLPFCSERPGIMHACGHDAHTAMLLVLAHLLAGQGIEKGAVKFMFQPAEEGEGGALKMINDGVLQNPKVDACLTFHVWAPYEIGQVSVLDGPQAASIDGFKIRIIGKGTHAAMPESGVDPIHIAAQIITSAQSIITRCIPPLESAVLSFTAINAGSVFNVIPEQADILGTFRTYDEKVRKDLRSALKELSSTIARSWGGKAEYESLVENVSTTNDPAIASLVREAAGRVVGMERIISHPPLMVGEDIGEVQKRIPGALALLGCGNPNIGADFPHHHPRFNIDERVLPIGVEIGLRFVEQFPF
ncbi:MAG: amidohydrolase [Proteobacteria bacterium]|nr:amidohydrolase [Pseudomonadota bacterium]